jgi:hypothetical protein
MPALQNLNASIDSVSDPILNGAKWGKTVTVFAAMTTLPPK